MLKKICSAAVLTTLVVGLNGCLNEEQAAMLASKKGIDLQSKQQQHIAYQLPPQYQWKLGDQTLQGINTAHVYIPVGESITHWTQSIGDYYFANTSTRQLTVQQSINTQKSVLQQQCNMEEWTISKNSDNDITYKTKVSECRDSDISAQFIISRTWQGKDGIYTLTYGASPAIFTKSFKNSMESTIRNASLQDNNGQ